MKYANTVVTCDLGSYDWDPLDGLLELNLETNKRVSPPINHRTVLDYSVLVLIELLH